ncbi:hypothetical protein PCCS19_14600 [Paenibacillus sp. CCS19]|nr:hypothetical protein PCCS19_14600 [Paenibacillus cellulosilyticus]
MRIADLKSIVIQIQLVIDPSLDLIRYVRFHLASPILFDLPSIILGIKGFAIAELIESLDN